MPPPANGQNNEGPASATSPESLSSYGNDIGERRKPTNEEAALSARNNRLAKELVRFDFEISLCRISANY